MSDYFDPAAGRQGLRRVIAVALALLGVAALLVGGSRMAPETATARVSHVPLVGRTSTVCTVGASDDGDPSQTTVSAVALARDPGAAGSLAGSELGSTDPKLTVSQQGKGAQLRSAGASVLLSAEGAMAAGSAGSVFASATTGVDAGLSAAPCVAPGTNLWFTGLGATDADRTDLVLSNPDDTQAEVDLRFFGPRGRLVVPGSPGVVVPARSSTVLSLSSLVDTQGLLGVAVRASEGRVSAVARRTRTVDLKPAGADWQVASAAPSTTVVVPGVPEQDGDRQLVVTNPGTTRATVTIQVLGLQGPFAAAGAESLQVAPESTASVDLTAGLAGEGGSVKLTSDQPVTAAVLSTSKRVGAAPDLSVQSAASPLAGTGVSAIATTDGADSEMILSNGGDADASVSFEVFSYDGVSLRRDDIALAANSTATRRLTSQSPSYLVVRAPAGSGVVGDVVLSQPDGDVAGLASVALTSPDVAGRVPRTTWDPSVGR